MGTFITDGSAVLPGIKADARPTASPPPATTWAAEDANDVRSALLDLRSAALAVTSGFVNPNVALVTAAGSSTTYALQDWMGILNAPDDIEVTATGTSSVRTLADRAADSFSVKDFGAVGDGTANDTAAIQAAITAGVAAGKSVYFPPGTYRVVPNVVSTDAAGTITSVATIVSGMHLFGSGDATLKMANSQSTDVAPKRLAFFHTNGYAQSVSFDGLRFDFNGANNPISPSRPSSYQTSFNMATISVSGNSAHADDVLVKDCVFMNTPGTNVIVAGQVTTAGSTLGKRWQIIGNQFLNNGLDTSDHSSVFAWVDDCEGRDNLFMNDSPYRTTGLAGMQTAWEIHGARQVWTGNRVVNALRGCYVACNYTSNAKQSVVANNVFDTQYTGVDIFRDATAATAGAGVSDILIANNTFTFDDTAVTGYSGYKRAVSIDDQETITDVLVTGNIATKTGTTLPSAFFWATTTTSRAAGGYSRLRVVNNDATGFTKGAYLSALQAVNSPWGYVEVSGNSFQNIVGAGGEIDMAVYVDAHGTIGSLKLDGNAIVSTGTTTYGYYIVYGTITDLWVGSTAFKGATTAYIEGGGITVTNRHGGSGASATISTGVGSVRMSTTSAATNSHWLPIDYQGTVYWVPAWTTNAP